MKKIYMAPALEEIRVQTTRMIAASEIIVLDSETEITNTSEILTREADAEWVFDDEDFDVE